MPLLRLLNVAAVAVVNDAAVVVISVAEAAVVEYSKQLAKLTYAVAIRGHNSFILEKKEKWTNKGTDNQYVADSFKHSTTYHYQILYQILR